jgi:hypothetical protein
MQDVSRDIVAIDAVPKILEVVCRSTGLGFAAVARVTEDRWIACGVRDDAGAVRVSGAARDRRDARCAARAPWRGWQ